jgi:hypothetical protein
MREESGYGKKLGWSVVDLEKELLHPRRSACRVVGAASVDCERTRRGLGECRDSLDPGYRAEWEW